MLRKRRFLSALLSLVLILGTIPITAMAERTESEGTGLCEHHPQHTAECGYTEGSEGTPCGHEHTGDCYTLVTSCVHEHTDECYPAESVSAGTATPSQPEEAEPTECTHVCSEESGCITEILDCKHEHDEACGHIPATQGTPCTYVCEICNSQDSGEAENAGTAEEPATPGGAIDSAVADVQALIDALPTAEELESMSQDEQGTVYDQVQAAYEAYNVLTDEQKELITGAETFDALFGVFNGMVAPAAELPGVQVDLSSLSSTYTISDSNTYSFTGSGSYGITVTSGSPTIVLSNATINVSSGPAINITGGSPTIKVEGNNTVQCSGSSYGTDGAGIYVAQGSSVTITADDRSSSLTARAGRNGAGIGSYNYGNTTTISCGNITITNVTVYAYPAASSDNSPGIGAYGESGTITIDNATVYAYGAATVLNSSPAIGSFTSSVPIINILHGSTIYAYRGAYNGTSYADYIGQGGTNTGYTGGQIQTDTGGSITNSTIHTGDYSNNTPSSTTEHPYNNEDSTPFPIEITATTGTTATVGYTTGPTLSVTATGSNLSYQWYKDSVSYANQIDGATSASYQVPTGLDVGNHTYKCVVSGGGYSLASEEIIFTVKNSQSTSPAAPSSASNVSTNSVTLSTVAGAGGYGDVQYGYTTGGGSASDINNWQGGATFTDLSAGTDYTFYTRFEGNDTYAPSSPSATGLTVTTLPDITTSSLGEWYVGVENSVQLSASAASGKTVTWMLTSGSTLPDGLTLNENGTITGMPSATAASHSFTVQATISGGAGGTQQVSNTATLTITINQGTSVITADTYNNITQTDTFNYGDTITVSGKIAASATVPSASNGISLLAEPEQNQVGLYVSGNDNPIATAVVDSNGNFTLSYDTAGQSIPIGEDQTLTVCYGGSSDLNSGSTKVQITLNKKSVTAQVQGDITKVYDGNISATVNLAVASSDLVNNTDVITVTGTGTYASPNVDTGITVTVSNIQTSGNDNGWYTVSAPNNVTGSITQSSSKLKVEPSSTSLTYGGMLEITVTVQDENENTFTGATGTVTLSNDNKTLATSDNPTDGVYTLTYNTTGKGLSVDSNDLTVSYNGDKNLQSSSTTAAVTLNQKSVSATIGGTMTKTYDGTVTAPSSLTISLSSVEPGDNVIAIGIATYNSANVSDAVTITVSSISLAGTHAGYYTLSSTEVSTSGSIIAANIEGTVSISGTPVCGQKLEARYSSVHTEQVTYQWYRNEKAIDGATSETYTLTVEDVGAAITVQATAADTNHIGYVTSEPTTAIGPSYTVTIPEKVDLGGTVTISASDVNVASGQQLAVEITGTSGADNAFTLTSQEGAEITYTVKAGNDPVSLNSTVLTVNGGKANANGATSLTFVEPDEEKIPFSGTYTGTMTFTIRTREVSGS